MISLKNINEVKIDYTFLVANVFRLCPKVINYPWLISVPLWLGRAMFLIHIFKIKFT